MDDANTQALADAVASYWTGHNVSLHRSFTSVQDSLEYLDWRNEQYLGYAELMPVAGWGGARILDYGCGPGHDLVGFHHFSRPSRLVGVDVSSSSLDEARKRLALHEASVELVQLSPMETHLPFEDGAFDVVHSSGVLHHMIDCRPTLREFHRVLRPGGVAQIMVYNADSIWMHLYVAWLKMIVENAYPGLDQRAAFARSTDGEECPISRAYTGQEFAVLAADAGFDLEHYDGAMQTYREMTLLPRRFEAIPDERLPAASRRFLAHLTFDNRGRPLHNGKVAGVDLCFRFRRV